MRHILQLDEEVAAGSDGGSLDSKLRNMSIGKSRKNSDFSRVELRKSTKGDKDRKLGDVTDDVHVCIMCLRAIMNNKFGFNMVIKHKQAINSIALSLIHKKLRTKALVLELLAAICLLKGGHNIILSAFDHFKQEMRETHRFETLVNYFTNPQEFQIEFMVACMQFINIVVHSVEDMNFRVALQYEFTALHLDDCLERLGHHESDELAVQISAYVDNEFNVAELMEEAELKGQAMEQVADLEEELGRVSERLSNNAKGSFIDCLEHFGEDSKTLDANAFFAILVRFCSSWKTAEVENVKREKLRKAQEAQKAQQENNNQGNQINNSMNNKNQANNLNKKNLQNSLIAELKNKNVGSSRKPIRQIPQDEIKDGTFEQIIMDIKSEPYCPRRSIRRNTDRLTSRPFDGEDL